MEQAHNFSSKSNGKLWIKIISGQDFKCHAAWRQMAKR
jgi:hypothetical protein